MSDLRQRKSATRPKTPPAASPADTDDPTDAVRQRFARESVLMKRIEDEAYEFNHPLLVFAFALGFVLLSYVGSKT